MEINHHISLKFNITTNYFKLIIRSLQSNKDISITDIHTNNGVETKDRQEGYLKETKLHFYRFFDNLMMNTLYKGETQATWASIKRCKNWQMSRKHT